MKNYLHRFSFAVTAALLALLFTSCSSSLTYQEAMNKNRRALENLEQLEDAQFLVDAKSYNILEEQMNQLAAEKGYSSTLVNYAKKNLEEHKTMSSELDKLARKEKIKVPSEMKSEHRLLFDQLSSESRADFDSRFVDIMKRINEESSSIYEGKASGAFDADIRAFAARKLDLFRAHAQEISTVDDQLMQTHR